MSNSIAAAYLEYCRYLIPFWKKAAVILLLSLVSVFLGLINPYLTKLMIDKAYANRDFKLLVILIIAGGLVYVLDNAIDSLKNYLSSSVKIKMQFDLNRKAFRKIQNFSYQFFQGHPSAKFLYNISYDIEQMTLFIVDFIPQTFLLTLRFICLLAIVFYLYKEMVFFSFLLLPFLFFIPRYFTVKLKNVFEAWINSSQKIFENLQEKLTHILLIKSFGKERRAAREFADALAENARLGLKNARIEVTARFVNSLSGRLCLGLIILFGGYQVIAGRMTLGSLSAIAIYFVQIFGLQNSLSQFFQQAALGFISSKRLEDVFGAEEVFKKDQLVSDAVFSKGEIEFNKVSFGYFPDKEVLANLGFVISGGACVGLVGHSGCGKTTIVKLILRLYKPSAGEILIEGSDIHSFKPKIFYDQIGVALQDSLLWNDTILNNILYGRPEASFEEVVQAVKMACLDDFINTLPSKYDTVIGENACKISEGQKQRISLARVFIKKPKILILDEAMSSLDSQTEEKIMKNIGDHFKGATIIVVSHRLSTVRELPLVYFLENPSSVAIGSHYQLLEGNAKYRDLFRGQNKIICVNEPTLSQDVS